MDKLNNWYQWYLSKDGVEHYAINSLLYITTLREKYVKIYEHFINQLNMYANAIKVLSKGYLSISLLPPMKLKEILHDIKKVIQISNPDYDIVIKRLHLYYDMKLVKFGFNKERNLIVQFPVFYTAIITTATYTVSN